MPPSGKKTSHAIAASEACTLRTVRKFAGTVAMGTVPHWEPGGGMEVSAAEEGVAGWLWACGYADGAAWMSGATGTR